MNIKHHTFAAQSVSILSKQMGHRTFSFLLLARQAAVLSCHCRAYQNLDHSPSLEML